MTQSRQELRSDALAEELVEALRNQINVANSNVGSINMGTIQSLNVKMNQLQQAGSPEMAAAFHALATAILKSSLPVGTRNDLTSQLEFVAGQAAAPSAERNTAMVKLALDALRTALSTTADLLQLWNQWGPALVAYFKITQGRRRVTGAVTGSARTTPE